MLNEVREERESVEGMSIPAYFDRYVTSEFRALEKQIDAFKEDFNHRFESVNQRFEATDRHFEKIDRRFEVVE